jgi:hypothetical protein
MALAAGLFHLELFEGLLHQDDHLVGGSPQFSAS